MPRPRPRSEASIAHQVESWSVLNDGDTIDEWVYQELGEQAPDGDLDESAARISRRVRNARSGASYGPNRSSRVRSSLSTTHRIRSSVQPRCSTAAGSTSPSSSWPSWALSSPTADARSAGPGTCIPSPGRSSSGPTLRENALRSTTPPGMTPARPRRERVRTYRGRRRVFDGQDYANLALYQRWRSRSLGSRLDASVENGFVVSSWNHWMKNRGLKAALAGIAVRPIDSRVDAEAWTVHDAKSARRLQVGTRETSSPNWAPPSIGKETPTRGAHGGRPKPPSRGEAAPRTSSLSSRVLPQPSRASGPRTSETPRSSLPSSLNASNDSVPTSEKFSSYVRIATAIGPIHRWACLGFHAARARRRNR